MGALAKISSRTVGSSGAVGKTVWIESPPPLLPPQKPAQPHTLGELPGKLLQNLRKDLLTITYYDLPCPSELRLIRPCWDKDSIGRTTSPDHFHQATWHLKGHHHPLCPRDFTPRLPTDTQIQMGQTLQGMSRRMQEGNSKGSLEMALELEAFARFLKQPFL